MNKEFRVFGPPGTGKTTYLARNIEEACDVHGPNRILVASFTKAAARELASRNLPIPENMVGTLHAHCYRTMNSPKIAEANVKSWNDAEPSFAIGSSSVDDPYSMSQRTEGERLYSEMNKYRAALMPRELWPAEVRYFTTLWERWKTESEFVDFTEMIEFALQFKPVAPGMPVVGFFDEVQDFTPLELKLVRKWTSHMERAIFAGDDDQTIYGFKGSSPMAFLNPPLPPTNVRTLNASWRLPRKVHSFAEAWVRHIFIRQPKVYSSRDSDGAVIRTSANYACPDSMIDQIRSNLNDSKSVMILATCSYMLRGIVSLLRTEGIPYHNPYRRERHDWNPLFSTEERRSFASRLSDLLVPVTENRYWLGKEFKSWVHLLRSGDILARGAKVALDKIPDDQILTPGALEHLFTAEALKGFIDMNSEEEFLKFFEASVLESKRLDAKFPLNVARRGGGRTLRDRPRVTVGTIHSVKGGEADCVYLFPDISSSGMREWMGGIESKDQIYRLFYVGITRARETLYLCSPSSGYFVSL